MRLQAPRRRVRPSVSKIKARVQALDNILKDGFHDECGVFGIYGHPEAARLTYLGLYQLQHRGQESCGIVSSDGEQLRSERAMGLVSEVFDEATLNRLPGHAA